MDFTEFREKYNISQDKLHKLVLEAHELYQSIAEDYEEASDESFQELDFLDYEFDAGSWREEQLYSFLQLLMDNEDE